MNNLIKSELDFLELSAPKLMTQDIYTVHLALDGARVAEVSVST